MVTSMGKHKDGRIVFLGTRPSEDVHFFEKLLQGSADFAANYSVPEKLYKEKPFRLDTIRKANPSLSFMPDLKETVLKEIERAKKDSTLLPSFLALRLNAGVSDVVESVLLEAGTWDKAEGNAPREGLYVLGLDLGESYSQTGVCGFWPDTGRLEAFAAFPQNPSLESRGTKDGVGSLYVTCHQRNELIIAGNRTTDVDEIIRVALSRWGLPSRIVCDHWRKSSLRDAMEGAGILHIPVELRRWGPHDGGEDVRTFRRATVDGTVKPVKSLLLRSSIGAARVVSDGRGNSTIEKARSGPRDDVACAVVLAVSSGVRNALTSTRSVYHGMAKQAV